jgi:hypothetical protein
VSRAVWWQRLLAHLKVFGIAVVFGLSAYVAVMALHALGRMLGSTL